MTDTIKRLIELVENLEKDFATRDYGNMASSGIMKENALALLANLKREQDDPANEEDDDIYEDLIFRIITIVGQL